MKGGYYYVAGYHRIIYCHDELPPDEKSSDGYLIFGGFASFFNEAKTNKLRQKITKQQFSFLKTTLLDVKRLEAYPFITKSKIKKTFCVTDGTQNTCDYLAFAERIEDLAA